MADKRQQLSRRERQIMDILHQMQQCSAHDVRNAMADAPSYSAVRALIGKLVAKELVAFTQQGAKYIYSPVMPREEAQQNAIQRLLNTFFEGSRVDAVNALLGVSPDSLTESEVEQLEKAIQRARKARGE